MIIGEKMTKKKHIITTSVIAGITILLIFILLLFKIVSPQKNNNDISAGVTTSSTEISLSDENESSLDVSEITTTPSVTFTEDSSDITTINENKTTMSTASETTTAKNTATTEKKTAKPTDDETTENPTAYIDADISSWINPSGNTIKTRFQTPSGYTRIDYPEGSYSSYIQNLPLKSHKALLMCYDEAGKNIIVKENQSWVAAIIDKEIAGSRSWLQCADFVMRNIADYLYLNERYEDIVFRLNSGFEVPFFKYIKGYRLSVKGNNVSLVYNIANDASASQKVYNNYMVYAVYQYANTASLKAQSARLSIDNIFPGSYFIMDYSESEGRPLGHAIMVADVAIDSNGKKAYLLAQGGTPSEEMHIFLNPLHPDNPWYYEDETYIGKINNKSYTLFDIPFRAFKQSNLYYLPCLLS